MAAGTRGPKRVGKENAPPAKVAAVEESTDGGDFDNLIDDPVKPVRAAKVAPAARTKSAKAKAAAATATAAAPNDDPMEIEEPHAEAIAKGGASGSGAESQIRLQQIEAENKSLRGQRDEYARQFEELSNLRSTATESTLEKFKSNIDVQGKAKDEIIATLSKLNKKLQGRIQLLEKAARSDAPKADPKEIKSLKEVAEKANEDLARRNAEYAELEKMYRTEQQYCQTLQASRSAAPTAPADKAPAVDESAEDAAIIRLYEDVTELNCVGVKIRPGRYGPKDKIRDFNCIQTSAAGSSINFRLRTFKELDPTKQAQRAPNPYNTVVQFNPELSSETDQAFIARLGKFREEMVFLQEDFPGLMRDLRRRVAGEME